MAVRANPRPQPHAYTFAWPVLWRVHARLVVHVCGRDHCLGISEMLRCHYCPAAVPLTVAFYPETDLQTFDAARHAGVGDFVVLTDEACNSDN